MIAVSLPNPPPCLPHWKPYQLQSIEQASSVYELGTIAIQALEKMPDGVVLISGPIASGSFDRETNISRLRVAIKYFAERQINVFDQLAFEKRLDELERTFRGTDFCEMIISELYYRMLECKRITQVHFIPNYNVSRCARAVLECCRTHRIETRVVTKRNYNRMLGN